MKVIMLISRYPPTVGGTEIQCSRLSSWLVQRGHSVTVLTEKSSPEQPLREWQDGVEVIRFRTGGGRLISSIFYALQATLHLLRAPRPDILHAHMIAIPAMVACLVSVVKKSPVLVKVAGGRFTGDFATSRRYRLGRIKLFILKNANPYVVCPSHETFEEARAFGIATDRLEYVPNGVDTHYFLMPNSSKAKLRAELGWPAEKPVALYAGRWAKGKGVEDLLTIWEKGGIRKDFNWRLAFVFSESPPFDISNRIEKLKKRVEVTINAGDLRPYYQAADLAILLSEGEGMSNFLLEAMSCGLATLTTQAAALPDTSGEETGTVTLSKGSSLADEAIAWLTRYSAEIDTLHQLGQTARRHIEQRFSLDRVGTAYETLYKQMKTQTDARI